MSQLPAASKIRQPLSTITNAVNNQPLKNTSSPKTKLNKNKSRKQGPTLGDANVDAARGDPQLWAKRATQLKKIGLDPNIDDAYVNEWHIYLDQDWEVWRVILTQTDIKKRINNFMSMYLLEKDDSALFGVWVRSGRIGASKGRVIFTEFQTELGDAKLFFERKFRKKTKQSWVDRDNFNTLVGQYNILYNNYNAAITKTTTSDLDARLSVVCVLEDRVIDLLSKVFGIVGMHKALLYDQDGYQFGGLSSSHISAGYCALMKIDGLITDPNLPHKDPALIAASNEFYSAIPHILPRKPDPIDDAPTIRAKVHLLQILGDLSAAVDTFGTPQFCYGDILELYESLECEIKWMDPTGNPDYQIIEKYLINSHCKSHYFRLEIIDVFSYHNECQIKKFVDKGNKMLLWHGQPASKSGRNVGNTLQCGRSKVLRSKSSGFRITYGHYFTDRSTRAANFSLKNFQDDDIILELYEVSLGRCLEVKQLQKQATLYRMHNAVGGRCDSIMASGLYCPDIITPPVTILNGVDVPMGLTVLNKEKCLPTHVTKFNKYVVEKSNHFILRYLVRVKVLYD